MALGLFGIVPSEPCIITLNTELSIGADFEIKFKYIGYGNNYLVSGISKGDHSSRAFLFLHDFMSPDDKASMPNWAAC